MPTAYMPEINANACSGWSEQDRAMYEALPYYFVKQEVQYRKVWELWETFMDKRPWQQNMGPIMRGVALERSPYRRQTIYPAAVCNMPRVDKIVLNERVNQAILYRHRFESLAFDFCTDFRSFVKDHINPTVEDITSKIIHTGDTFYRTMILEMAPYIYICGKKDGTAKMTAVAQMDSSTGTSVKTAAYLGALAQLVGSNLTFAEINSLGTSATEDLQVMPFSGNGAATDNEGLNDKWAIVTSSEAWDQFVFDPWMDKRPVNLDIVFQRFKGNLWGKYTCRIERFPLRMKLDGTFPEPETVEMNPNAPNYGETIPNPVYTDPAQSPIEFGWLVGAPGYEVLRVGPPPKVFASNGMPDGFGKMQWNGEVFLSKNILVPCLDADGSTVHQQTNVYGEKIQAFSQAVYGIMPRKRQQVIPVMYMRRRGDYA